MKATAILGLGSNLGDRREQLAQALRKMGEDPAIAIVRGSSLYETKPVGVVDQPDFLNMVVQIRTSHLPLTLLAVCLGIEAGLGRERLQRWGPRSIDLDILLYDQVKLNDERLVLPHPRMHERSFVLSPLAEIAPEQQLRGKTVRENALGVGMAGLRRLETWADFSNWSKISSERRGRNMIVEEIPSAPLPEKIAHALRGRRGFFYLDSGRAEGNARPAFSFIGFDPFLTWCAKEDKIIVDSDGCREEFSGDPLAHLRELMGRYRSPQEAGIPFCGGAVGYFGYEFGARVEGIHASGPDDVEIPDAMFGFYDGVVAIEHSSGKTYVIANPVAQRTATEILARLREAVGSTSEGRLVDEYPHRPFTVPAGEPVSNLTRKSYLARVACVKEYIAAGDVYQVNLSQQFEMPVAEDPYAIYQRLRALSPAPFGAYLDLGGFQILSSSPELFLRVDEKRRALTRPIKGTRPRGKTPAEDQRLSAELLASEKDHAELLMIVDLERNDLGRVCRYGSIHVEELHRIETHPTVFHLVATIVGQLREDADVFDCLRSMLPGGSITGAPKIRAMQIIDELEPCRRHIYTGSLGYLGFDGTCDLNIAIRTILCQKGRASYHVGGGIVSDSEPDAEYQETLAKGRAMRAALVGEQTTR